jgi:hypothetical protein
MAIHIGRTVSSSPHHKRRVHVMAAAFVHDVPTVTIPLPAIGAGPRSLPLPS